MKKIEVDDVYPLAEYEKVREAFRKEIIEQKKKRRVQVGPYVSLTFENRETLLFQIQEMLRAERIEAPEKIQEEVDVYNDLVPGPRELSATLFIEITEEGKIKEVLDRLIGIDRGETLFLQIGKKKKIPARFETGRSTEEQISAVHFIRFKLDITTIETFRSERENFVVIEHPNYKERAAISEETKELLLGDLDQGED
ncbi:MAG: DUF3501 family protein [Nitrospirae bacterium]|nr:DUF3501 family protein [Candidatus Manganitrophaceae bacterium]